jgi:diguanylate cyclase (GGDEF)-like protein/PAS domain S-box-containing protein
MNGVHIPMSLTDLTSTPERSTDQAPGSWPDDAAFLSEIIETQNDIAAVELDLQTILQMVVQRTQKLTGADGASIQIVEGDHLTFHAVSGQLAEHAGSRLGLASSFSGRVASSGIYGYCHDTHTDDRVDREVTDRLGIRSLVNVPICHGADVVGILNVSSRSTRAFGQREIAALRLMAGLVAAAFSHTAEFETKKRLLAERTQALADLRDSEERFRSAFDHAAIGMAMVALDGRWLQVNRSLCQIVGYTQQELLVSDFQSITYPDDLNADLAQVHRLIAGEIQDYQMVKRYTHRQGHLVWVLLSVSLVRDGNGKAQHFISQIQDVTQRKETEDALRASEIEYRTTFEMAGVGKAQVDLQTGMFVRANRKLCEMLGYSAEELKTLAFRQVVYPDDRPATDDVTLRMSRGEQMVCSCEKRFVRKDGHVLWTLLNATVITGADGRPLRSVSTIQDVTERHLAEQLERDRRRVLEMVAKDMPLPHVLGQLAAAVEAQIPGCVAGVFSLQDGHVLLHGPNLPAKWRKAILGHSLQLAADLARGTWNSQEGCGVTSIDDDEIWKDLRPAADNANLHVCWTTAIRGTDTTPLGSLTAYLHKAVPPTTAQAQTMDMAAKLAAICIEHHNTTRKLSHLVRHDTLTGLANRIMFEDRLQHAMDLAGRSGNRVGLLALDVDKFKSINDTFGHQTGDHLLQQFAHRLQNILRDTDTMARMGGDEFVIVLPELKRREGAAAVAQKLVDALTDPFVVGELKLAATTSIGIAIYPDDAPNGVKLQKQADEALYRVKQNSRNGFGF